MGDLILVNYPLRFHAARKLVGDLDDRRNDFIAMRPAQDFRADVNYSVIGNAAEHAGDRFALQCVDQLLDDGLARVVEDLVGADPLDVLEVFGGGGGEDLVAKQTPS
ncbi:unnamed protein product [Calypogeia fissa]